MQKELLHVSTRTASSWGSPAPRYYHGQAVSCCLPAPCAPPSLWELHTLSCLIPIPISPPLPFPTSLVAAAQPGLQWGVEVAPRLRQVGSMLDALPAHPALHPSPGARAVQVSRRVLQSIFLGLVCEINHCCWNQLSLQLQAGWLDVLLLFTSRVDVDSIVCVGKKKSSRNNYEVSSLNDQVSSE